MRPPPRSRVRLGQGLLSCSTASAPSLGRAGGYKRWPTNMASKPFRRGALCGSRIGRDRACLGPTLDRPLDLCATAFTSGRARPQWPALAPSITLPSPREAEPDPGPRLRAGGYEHWPTIMTSKPFRRGALRGSLIGRNQARSSPTLNRPLDRRAAAFSSGRIRPGPSDLHHASGSAETEPDPGPYLRPGGYGTGPQVGLGRRGSVVEAIGRFTIQSPGCRQGMILAPGTAWQRLSGSGGRLALGPFGSTTRPRVAASLDERGPRARLASSEHNRRGPSRPARSFGHGGERCSAQRAPCKRAYRA